jgi:WD40 repeat protein
LWDGPAFSRHTVFAKFPVVNVATLAFSPDGSDLAIGLHDGEAGIWALSTGQEIVPYHGSHSRVTALAFSPDGREVTSAVNDGTTIVWTAHAGEQVRIPTVEGEPFMMALSHNRVTVAFFAGTVGVWDARTGRQLERFRAFAGNSFQGGLVWPSLSPDGSLLAYQSRAGGSVLVARVGRRQILRSFGPDTGGTAGFTTDNSRVAIFGPTRDYVANLPDGQERAVQDAQRGASCGGFSYPAFSNDGKLLVASTFCGLVGIWDGRTGRLIRIIRSPSVVYTAPVFSPDGREVAWGSTDTTASIWSVATGTRIEVLPGHSGSVTSVAFDPTGRMLASASLDMTVRIWDLATGRTLRIIHGPDFAPAFSSDGRELVASDHPGTVEIWQTCPACGDAHALLALANRRVTRSFTPQERTAYLTGL